MLFLTITQEPSMRSLSHGLLQIQAREEELVQLKAVVESKDLEIDEYRGKGTRVWS